MQMTSRGNPVFYSVHPQVGKEFNSSSNLVSIFPNNRNKHVLQKNFQ